MPTWTQRRAVEGLASQETISPRRSPNSLPSADCYLFGSASKGRDAAGLAVPLPPPSSASGSGGARSVLAEGAAEPRAEPVGAASVEPASRVKRVRNVGLIYFSLLAEVSHHLFRKQKTTTGSSRHHVPRLPPGTKQPWEARCCPHRCRS